ncbi:class I SAM-dependent methyltransferase [Nocardia sp. CY41]|uniref:class I SAM-dependent methyltransferase n=1 Tax=Nocardia sp. CY41 TaxID=2608686 RepID=UPI00135BA3C5|nr:class I SAM-dependent methyltransferase [Nocardia sp. CY41]
MSLSGARAFDWSTLPAAYPAQYERLNESYGQVYTAAAERLVTVAGIGRGSTVVDVGAGSGFSAEIIARAIGRPGNLLAVDPSVAMLDRARERIYPCSIFFRAGRASDVHSIAASNGFSGCDAVLSSFTYYYTFHNRRSLHRAVHGILKPGGKWAFNLTKYLGALRIAGKVYNEFGDVYVDHLKSIAARHGIRHGDRNEEESDQFADTDWEVSELLAAGFTDIEVEAWALPMTPSAAFRFTLDGFYSHGSRVTFLPALMDLPIGNRIEIMREALTECSKELDSYPRPHIANLVAMRP